MSTTRRLLLDVNVWIALLDDAHVHNQAALALFQKPRLKIATCPLVENGVLRILNLPGYSQRGPVGFEIVRAKMALACADVDHTFWSDDISLRTDGLVNWDRVFSHGQITDLYLLALAVAHDGALTTFDHRIALNAVTQAEKHHLMLL
ncbi:MAG: PIN domain-containing protein [Burkholderiales bacterium]|nr:PIN domain-containing protein [Burkholderiales bacterium]